MKYVQAETIQRKISGGGFHGEKFPEEGLLSKGELFRGNCLGVVVFEEIIQR